MFDWFRPKPSSAGRLLQQIGARKRKATERERYVATNLELMHLHGIAPPKHWVGQ